MSKPSPRKRLGRDPKSGKFEAPSPQTDPQLRAFAVKTIAAIEHLEPIFSALMKDADRELSEPAAMAAWLISTVKEAVRDELEVNRKTNWRSVPPHIRAAAPYAILSPLEPTQRSAPLSHANARKGTR